MVSQTTLMKQPPRITSKDDENRKRSPVSRTQLTIEKQIRAAHKVLNQLTKNKVEHKKKKTKQERSLITFCCGVCKCNVWCRRIRVLPQIVRHDLEFIFTVRLQFADHIGSYFPRKSNAFQVLARKKRPLKFPIRKEIADLSVWPAWGSP